MGGDDPPGLRPSSPLLVSSRSSRQRETSRAFRGAARDDLAGWEVASAAAEVAGAAVNPGQLSHSAVCPAFRPRAGRQSARDEVALQLHPGGQGHHVEACREQ